MDSKEIRNKLADYINENEFFWRKDLYNHLGIKSNEYNLVSSFFVTELKNKNIVVVDKNGSEKQYMRINKILKSCSIIWKEGSREYFGLDYSYLIGNYGDFKFDIRYDSDGEDHSVEPKNCGFVLNVFVCGSMVGKSYFSKSLDSLKEKSKELLKNFIKTNE